MPAALRDRPGIPIAQVGRWSTTTGEWECTEQQLRDAVLAQHDPAFRAGVLKLGHTDPRFTDGVVLGDGEPAVGRVINLRLSEDAQTLLCDWVGIPAWLDDVMETAYPSRSIEAALDVTTSTGAKYSMVVTGCALLGVTTPAIQSLGDIAALFGQDTSVEAYVAASRVAAAALPQEEPMPPVRELGQVVMASASIDELTRQFQEWADDQPLLGDDCWVRDIYTDYLVATVWRGGGDSLMYRCSWAEKDGQFTFGVPSQVRPTYEPVPSDSAAATASASGTRLLVHDVIARRSHRDPSGAVLSARGRAVAAGGQTNEESRVPIKPALAELLGVAEDADDEAVEAAARALRDKADAPQTAAPTTQESGTAPAAPADIQQLVAASVAQAVEPFKTQLTATSAELAGFKAAAAAETKRALFDGAVAAGKIAPAARAGWEARYDKGPEAAEVVTEVLASLAAGSAVPTAPIGHAGGEVNSMSAEDEALWASVYGNAPAGSDA
jgi:hypothetical protein